MRTDSPRWEQINPSPFPHERDGLRLLADYLPDTEPYHVWTNVEFVGADGSINEVDALVLTTSGLYVLELKHWSGEIRGDGTQWVRRVPNGRLIPEDNPYILANRKAKRLASLIRFYASRQRQGVAVPFVGAMVFLHAITMQADLDPIGQQHVYGIDRHPSGLPSLRDGLLAPPADSRRLVDATRAREIVDLVKGAKIRPSVADRKVGQLLLHQRPFAEGLGWQDFLAGHVLNNSLERRVRFYLTSRATDDEVPVIRKAAEREFGLLQGIHHPGIAAALDLVDHPWGPAVVFDHHRDMVRLDQWLTERHGKLTIAQRLQLVQELAEIIDYAHSRRLVHRALHPRAIFVRDPQAPNPELVVTDWQTGGRMAAVTQLTQLPSSDPTGLELFFGNEVRHYRAPEAAERSRAPGHQLDVFSLGAVAYRIFAGVDPTATPEELATLVRDSGLNLAAAVDGMPDTLVTMVYDATRGDPALRTPNVAKFRAALDNVWEELTAPEPEPVIDPLQARKGDVLDGGLVVRDRLGSGATATALLVSKPDKTDGRDLVLKVARDERHADRFADEARTLDKLKHWQIAGLVAGPIIVGGRTALLVDSAGERTLAEDLREGRLAIDALERYGRDLLDIVAVLDAQGVWHRDLKPANLATRPRPKDKQPHLCAFDFSLASTPADQLTAGTRPYLDPFLGPPRRLRFDAAAERYAAAVTLYEMATGRLPRWGDDANPASVSDEVTLDPADFESGIADRLVAFFRRALAREVADRFGTLDEMTDAWRAIFQNMPETDTGSPQRRAPDTRSPVSREAPLEATNLTIRARSALQRLGVHTIGELLDYEPSALTRARGVQDATRKEILAEARGLRALLPLPRDDAWSPGATPEAGDGGSGEMPAVAEGIETLCAGLLPPDTPGNRQARAGLRVLLGQSTGTGDTFLCWPSKDEAVRFTEQAEPGLSTVLREQVKTWATSRRLAGVRDEIVALLDDRGAVMSSRELAEALLASRGSYTSGARRLAQAVGLVRAAVETELASGGDSRVAMYRFRSGGTVLVGREPDDVTSVVAAEDLLGYVARLGTRAIGLVSADLLPTRQRAIDELRVLPPPEGMPAVSDQRLLQLAAAGSNDRVDVNTTGQLYPVGMPAERALRLASGSLIGQRLSAEAVRARVRARFPLAEELPERLRLDDLLRDCDVPLTWYEEQNGYGPPRISSALTGTRIATTVSPLLRPDAAAEVTARLAAAIDRRAFVALLSPMRHLTQARRALLSRLHLTEVDVTAIMLEQLRALGYPWEMLVAADTGVPTDVDFRSLVELVQYHVVPEVTRALDHPGPVLVTEAAPLVRYGQQRILQELADPARSRPAARFLLVPARRAEPALLDGWQLPLVSQSSQAVWLPETWISPAVAPSG
jgi:serine/threonine protein kinase